MEANFHRNTPVLRWFMHQIREFVDERQKAWCIYCGGLLTGARITRDHVPSRSLLMEPYPTNLPIISAHARCNNEFSKDEQYLTAFLGAVLTGSTDPAVQTNPKARRALESSPKLRADIERVASYETRGGETRLVWRPSFHRVDRVVLKNARGHVFFEHGEPIFDQPENIWAGPIEILSAQERAMFENVAGPTGWAEVGSRMLTRLAGGHDLSSQGWINVQEGVYRYGFAQKGMMCIRSVMFEYLATEVCWV